MPVLVYAPGSGSLFETNEDTTTSGYDFAIQLRV